MSNRYTVSLAIRALSIALLLMVTICGGRALAQSGNAPRTLTVTNPSTGFVVRTTDGGLTWEQVRSDEATGSRQMQIQQSAMNTLGATAWPNPTSGATTIRFRLAQPGAVVVTLHDMQGNEVARFDEGAISAGEQAVSFDTSKLAGGTYYYRMTSNGTPGGGGLLVVAH